MNIYDAETVRLGYQRELMLIRKERDDLLAALRKIERASTGQMDQSDDDIEAAFAGIHAIVRAALAKAAQS